jgi:MFS family permease
MSLRSPGRAVFLVLLGATALGAAGNSAIFALLPELQDRYGFSDAGLGVITAAGFGMSFLVQLLVAPLADRGHPRLVLIIGAVASVAGNIVCATSSGLWTISAARALIGAASGCFAPTARALAASISTEGRAERLGRMASIETAGFVVGPVIGGALVGPFGVRWPFVVFCALGIANIVLVSSIQLPELQRRTDSGRISIGLIRERPVLYAVVTTTAYSLPIGMYDALWARYLTDRGASSLLVGVSLACYAVPFTVLAGFGGRLTDRYGAGRVAVISTLMVAPFTVAYSLFTNPWIPIAIGIGEAVVSAVALPATQTVTANAAPPGRAAGTQGLAGATSVATMAVVALVSSALYGAYGPRTTFISVAITGATIALIARALRPAGFAGAPVPAPPVVVESH